MSDEVPGWEEWLTKAEEEWLISLLPEEQMAEAGKPLGLRKKESARRFLAAHARRDEMRDEWVVLGSSGEVVRVSAPELAARGFL